MKFRWICLGSLVALSCAESTSVMVRDNLNASSAAVDRECACGVREIDRFSTHEENIEACYEFVRTNFDDLLHCLEPVLRRYESSETESILCDTRGRWGFVECMDTGGCDAYDDCRGEFSDAHRACPRGEWERDLGDCQMEWLGL